MNFFSYKNNPDIPQDKISTTVYIPKNIKDKNELFNIFVEKLNFPDYFGYNWDALFECLIDLSFLQQKNVYIIHEDIPFEDQNKEKTIYLDILADVEIHWVHSEEHKVFIFFPENTQEKIVDIIKKIMNEWH